MSGAARMSIKRTTGAKRTKDCSNGDLHVLIKADVREQRMRGIV